MLGLKAILNVVDNSGALKAELINVYKVKPKPKKSIGFATVGDEVKVVIKRTRGVMSTNGPGNLAQPRFRKGDMARGVIVRVRKTGSRADGRTVQFDDSAVVLLNAKGEMMGSRVIGPVSAALRDIRTKGGGGGARWSKIITLATRVI